MSIFSFAQDEDETVFVRKAPFRMILARARGVVPNPEDLDRLQLAEEFDSLAFWRLDPADRDRLGHAVMTATEQLRRQIAGGEQVEEPVLPDIDDKLREVIELFMRHLEPAA